MDRVTVPVELLASSWTSSSASGLESLFLLEDSSQPDTARAHPSSSRTSQARAIICPIVFISVSSARSADHPGRRRPDSPALYNHPQSPDKSRRTLWKTAIASAQAILTPPPLFCTLPSIVNLLLLTWNFPPAVGGMEAMMDHLFRGLRRRGHSVQAVTTRGNGEPMEDVHRAPRPGVPAYLLFSFFRGWTLCRKQRPDFILCGSVLSAPASVSAARRLAPRRPRTAPLRTSFCSARRTSRNTGNSATRRHSSPAWRAGSQPSRASGG